jgi:hypothetical protein
VSRRRITASRRARSRLDVAGSVEVGVDPAFTQAPEPPQIAQISPTSTARCSTSAFRTAGPPTSAARHSARSWTASGLAGLLAQAAGGSPLLLAPGAVEAAFCPHTGQSPSPWAA